MEIKAKRRDLMNMLGRLSRVGNLKGFKLAYAVARNKRALELEQAALNAAMEPKPDFLEYEDKRIGLAKKHAEKDEHGRPKEEGGRFLGLMTNKVWQAEFEALKEEYKDAREAYTQQKLDYEAALDEEIEFEMFMVGVDQIPEDVTVDQTEAMYLMIRDHEGIIERAEPEPEKAEEPKEPKPE